MSVASSTAEIRVESSMGVERLSDQGHVPGESLLSPCITASRRVLRRPLPTRGRP